MSNLKKKMINDYEIPISLKEMKVEYPTSLYKLKTADGSAQGQSPRHQTNKLLGKSYDKWEACRVIGLNG